MPEKIFSNIKNRIMPQWWVCFYSALTIGMLAHFYKITNWLPNWDSLVFRYDAQNMIGLGRWFLPVVCSFSSFYDLPFLNGIISIILHAVSAVCICKVLDVKKNVTAFLIGAMIVSFPTVTSVMMYNYVADGYSFAFLLSCMAVICITEKKPRYIAAVCLIALSVGIYQAYITVVIMLLLFKLIDRLVFEKEDVSSVLKSSLAYMLVGILGMALYYIILKLLLFISGESLLEYQGIDSAFSVSNINLFASLYSIKEIFLGYFFDFVNGLNLFTFLNIAVFTVTTYVYIEVSAKNKLFKSPLKMIVLSVLLILLIIGSKALAFINPSIDYHNLMLMGYCVFYLFFVMLYENRCDKNEKRSIIKSWTVLIISLVIIINQIVLSNVCYHKAQMSYEKSYGTLIRLADRIEQAPGADLCEEIVVIGALDDSKDYSVSFPPDITGITDGFILRADDEQVGQSVLCSALNDYAHKNYKFLSGERKQELLSRDEVINMNKWPLKDSVMVVDNVIVIKLGADSE